MAFYARTSYTLPTVSGQTRNVTNQTEFVAALAAAQGRNDIIVLANGNYTIPGWKVDWQGAGPDSRLVIAAANKHGAVIDDVGTGSCGYLRNCDYLHFYGIRWLQNNSVNPWLLNVGNLDGNDEFGLTTLHGEGTCRYLTWTHNKFEHNGTEGGIHVSGPADVPSEWLEFIDCDIVGGQREGLYTGYGNEGSSTTPSATRVLNLLIRGCDITGTGDEPIDIKPHSRNVIIEHNTIHDCTVANQAGITVGLNTDNGSDWYGRDVNYVVRYNRVWNISAAPADNDGTGIYCGVNGCDIYGNAIWNCNRGIQLGNGALNSLGGATRVYNNTVWNVGNEDILCHSYPNLSTQTIDVQGNLLEAGVVGATGDASNNLNASSSWFVGPLTGSADAGTGPGSGFRLTASATRNTAPALALINGTLDLYGVARPTSTGIDHGAFEDGTAAGAGVPVADFTWSPGAPQPGQPLSFVDLSTNTPTSWSWSFGDSTSSTAQNPTKTYASAGTYTVSLTATNGSGSHTVTKSVTVTAPGAFETPTVVGRGQASHFASTLSIPIPAEATPGRLILMFVTGPPPAAGGATPATFPAGWTKIEDVIGTTLQWGPHLAVAWKFAVASDAGSSITVTCPGTTSWWNHAVLVVDGVNSTTPIDVEGASDPNGYIASGTVSITGPTTVTNNALWLTVLADGGGGLAGRTWTTPTGHTREITQATYQGLQISSKLIPTAAATGSTTWALNAGDSNHAKYSLALRPRTGGTSGVPDPPVAAMMASATTIEVGETVWFVDLTGNLVEDPYFLLGTTPGSAPSPTAVTPQGATITFVDSPDLGVGRSVQIAMAGATSNPVLYPNGSSAGDRIPATPATRIRFEAYAFASGATRCPIVIGAWPHDAAGTILGFHSTAYNQATLGDEGQIVYENTTDFPAGTASLLLAIHCDRVGGGANGTFQVTALRAQLLPDNDPVTSITIAAGNGTSNGPTAQPPPAPFGPTAAGFGYLAAGTYTAVLTAVGPGGTDTTELTITVAEPAGPGGSPGELPTEKLAVDAAFSYSGLFPVWTTVHDPDGSPRASLGLSITRGRSARQDLYEPAQAVVTVDNSDGQWDPENPTGLYSDDIKPGLRIRVRETAHNRTLFIGRVQEWPTVDRFPGDSTVDLVAEDILAELAAIDLPTLAAPANGGLMHERANAALNAAGIDALWRQVFAGQTRMLATTWGRTLLDELVLVADSDGGAVWSNSFGQVVVVNRHDILTAVRSRLVQRTFDNRQSPVAGAVRYAPGPRVYSPVVNYAEIGHVPLSDDLEESPAVAQDASSQATYGLRSVSRTDLECASITDCQAIAEFMVAEYGTPIRHLASLTVRPLTTDSDEYDAATYLELRDRVRVVYETPYGLVLDQECFIERISHDIDDTSWATTFGLSPAGRLTALNQSDWVAVGAGTVQAAGRIVAY